MSYFSASAVPNHDELDNPDDNNDTVWPSGSRSEPPAALSPVHVAEDRHNRQGDMVREGFSVDRKFA